MNDLLPRRPISLHVTDSDLRRWTQNELTSDERDFVEFHLETCGACADRLEKLVPSSSLQLPVFRRAPSNDETMHESGTLFEDDVPQATKGHCSGNIRWQPELLLASGGIGEVWIALDVLLDRIVAVKKLKQETAGFEAVQKRFLYEAEITAQLNHPGVASVFDLVVDGPQSFYVMSLVRGATLRSLIQRFHQEENDTDVLTLVRNWIAVSRTVAFAHSHGILHRDLKSENVVVGEFGQVTVLDWGLAKRIGDTELDANERMSSASGVSTRIGARLGTPSFMSPEQASGRSDEVDERTDVWGLSAMLYEILTGQPPFNGVDAEATMEKVIQEPLVPPRAIRNTIPGSLSRICEIGLAKSQDSRPSTAQELLQSVQEWMDKESERRTSALARQRLFDLSDDLMFVYDLQSRIVWGNAAWFRKLGWSPEERIGEPAETLVHPEDRISQELRDRIIGGETVSGHENRILSGDGHYRWYSWTMTPILDEGIVCAVGREIQEHRVPSRTSSGKPRTF